MDTWVDDMTAYERPHKNSESYFLCLKVFEKVFLTIGR